MSDSPQGRHRNAYALYAQILGQPRPGLQQAELNAVVLDLGLTPEEVEADRRILLRFQALEKIECERQVTEALLADRQAAIEQTKLRHRDELDEHDRALARLSGKIAAADKAVSEMESLEQQRPELFDAQFHPPRLVSKV